MLDRQSMCNARTCERANQEPTHALPKPTTTNRKEEKKTNKKNKKNTTTTTLTVG